MRIASGVRNLSWCCLLLAMAVSACDDDGTGATTDAGGGDAAAEAGVDMTLPACSATGTASLTVTVGGLPAGVTASVSVASAGAPAPTLVTATQTLSLPAGPYTITASRVAGPPAPLVRTAYEPVVTGLGAAGALCLRAGSPAPVTVTYGLIATSNKLWLTNANGTAPVLGYTPDTVSATGMPAASITAMTKSSAGFTFDAAGNLWALGSTTVDPPIARYAAASLGGSGAKIPDIEIESPSFGGGSPGPKVLAFDAAGNLWSTVVWADKVVRFSAAQIAASGMPTASVEITGLEGPGALAFDKDGNLWVTAEQKVVRIDASRLASSSAGPSLAIAMQTAPPSVQNLRTGAGLAFDKDGNLWVEAGSLVRLTPADLAGSGTKTIVPGVIVEPVVTALPGGLAIDEGGGLWVAWRNGSFARLAPGQLTASGMPTPAVLVTSADVGAADYFAIYPAPAGLPLYHRLP